MRSRGYGGRSRQLRNLNHFNSTNMGTTTSEKWPEDVRRSRLKPEPKELNPYACFGRKPHIMDFEDKDEYLHRLANWQEWEEKHNN